MNTSELITEIAERTGVTKTIAKKMIEVQAEIIAEQLQAGNSVTIHGSLGSFKSKEIAEKMGRNPKENKPQLIHAHIKPYFQASVALKKALN